MDFTAALALIASAVLAPVLVAVITRPTWSSTTRRYVAAGVCAVLGIVAAVGTGAIDGIPESWQTWTVRVVVGVGVVVSLAQGFYQIMRPALDKLEAATSPKTGDGLS